MEEHLVSLTDRLREVSEGKRETIEGMAFWGALGGDTLRIINFDRNSKNFQYARRFAGDDGVLVSSDLGDLADFKTYFDVQTINRKEVWVYPIPEIFCNYLGVGA